MIYSTPIDLSLPQLKVISKYFKKHIRRKAEYKLKSVRISEGFEHDPYATVRVKFPDGIELIIEPDGSYSKRGW